ANGVTIRNCAVIDASTDGIRAANLDGADIENSIVVGATNEGIYLRRVTNGTVRNNLVYDNDDWGISLDNTGPGGTLPAGSTGNLVGSNPSAGNTTGDFKLLNAIGEVRDNLLTDTPGVGLRIDTAGATVHHNGFFNDTTQIDPPTYIVTCAAGCPAN